MKNSIKYLILIWVFFSSWACTNQDIVVRYPNSFPAIENAKVAESVISYGDSIHLDVTVSDNVAPLSTLLVQVVVNTEVVTSEVIRTKGNTSSVKRTYGVPFVANRPDNEPVKVYLTSTNVEGFTKDSIVSTTIAKRPVIPELWLIVDGPNKGKKLTLIDPVKLIYSVTGLTFGTSIDYKIATKVKGSFSNVIDYSGLVFGKVGDGIGLIDSTGLSINSTDGTLVGISEFSFDALKFTAKVGGKLLEPVKTLDINVDLPAITMSAKNFRGGNVYFGENVEVTFTGITTDLANSLSPDYFQVTGTNKAKFLGKTGLYKAYFLIEANYMYIEPQPEALYPDALWICGTGFGRPSSPYMTTASWNWNSPLDYIPCRLVSTGIYQATIYVKNAAGTGIYGTTDFKYFHKRGWWDGHEEWADKYTVSAPFLGPGDVNGNMKVLSTNLIEGVYQITLNQNDKTIKAVKKLN